MNLFQQLTVRIVVSLTCGAIDCWSIISFIRNNPTDLLGFLGPPEYAAIIFFSTGLLISVNFQWLKSLLPSTRFTNLAPEIESVRNNLANSIKNNLTPLGLISDLITIDYKLNELGIFVMTYKNVENDDRDEMNRMADQLLMKLDTVLAFSKLGYLSKARKAFKNKEKNE